MRFRVRSAGYADLGRAENLASARATGRFAWAAMKQRRREQAWIASPEFSGSLRTYGGIANARPTQGAPRPGSGHALGGVSAGLQHPDRAPAGRYGLARHRTTDLTGFPAPTARAQSPRPSRSPLDSLPEAYGTERGATEFRVRLHRRVKRRRTRPGVGESRCGARRSTFKASSHGSEDGAALAS